jgi:flagellar motility protein MotE (MotC chaperone)
MIERVRLFPVLAVSAALLGGVKAVAVWNGVSALVPPVMAADAPPAATPDKSADNEAKGDKAPTDKAAAGANADADQAELQPDSDGNYSPAELQVLQSLSARRAELDKREKDLDMREQVLKITEKRLQDKLAEIKKVQGEVDAALKTYDDKESAQIANLVNVYQTMKPADAARIMSTLDMKVLIDVAQRMSSRKIAPIMAAMDSATAKKLTMELATRKPLLADNKSDTATQ